MLYIFIEIYKAVHLLVENNSMVLTNCHTKSYVYVETVP